MGYQVLRDGSSAIRTGAFDAPNAPIALVGLGEKRGDLGDGVGRGAVEGVRPRGFGFRWAAWRVVWLCQ